MRNFSVAMIVAQFPNIVQTYINSTISGLQKQNVDVEVISSGKPNKETPFKLKDKEIPKKIIYADVELPKLFIQLLMIPYLSLSYWNLVLQLIRIGIIKDYGIKYFIKSLIRLKYTAHQNYDILHSHTLTYSYEFLFLKNLYSIPIVTTFHGKEPKESKTLSFEKQQTVFREGDCFIVNTNFAKISLIELGCPEKKIKILPQGTNINNFPYYKREIKHNKNINILTVGRLSIEKGQHIAVKAMALLKKRFPNIRYHLVGNGPELTNLKELINNLQLQDIVILHGYLSPKELQKLYSEAEIFILPSIDLKDGLHVETQGVVIQEAQASGIPVIASRTGGIPEVIRDNTTGIIFEENNHEDLTLKITNLIQNDDLYSDLCTNGRSDIENRFNSDVLAEQLIKLYQNCNSKI